MQACAPITAQNTIVSGEERVAAVNCVAAYMLMIAAGHVTVRALVFAPGARVKSVPGHVRHRRALSRAVDADDDIFSAAGTDLLRFGEPTRIDLSVGGMAAAAAIVASCACGRARNTRPSFADACRRGCYPPEGS